MKSFCAICILFLGAVFGLAAVTTTAGEPQAELPRTGVNLARDDGGWINVVVVDNSFALSFFNDKKMPTAADVHHGLVRYKYVAKSKDRTALTLSADGKTLISPHNVVAPFVFRVHLALFNEGPDDLAETYAFSYRAN